MNANGTAGATYPFARLNLLWYCPGIYVLAVKLHSVLFQSTIPALVEKSVKETALATNTSKMNSFIMPLNLSFFLSFSLFPILKTPSNRQMSLGGRRRARYLICPLSGEVTDFLLHYKGHAERAIGWGPRISNSRNTVGWKYGTVALTPPPPATMTMDDYDFSSASQVHCIGTVRCVTVRCVTYLTLVLYRAFYSASTVHLIVTP